MAWKLGKIRHGDSDAKEKFVYQKGEKGDNGWRDDSEWQELDDDGWDAAEVVTISSTDGNKFKLGKLANYLYKNRERLEEKALSNEGAKEVLAELKGLDIHGLGPVYSVTLLYFLSRGRYPIYDQFAKRGLMAIDEGVAPRKKTLNPSELPNVDKDKIGDAILGDGTSYREYAGRIHEIEKEIEGCGLKNRDLDRALWTYGHLFN